MAHPLRRHVFKLCAQKARSVGELAQMLNVNPGTALYHVRRLEGAGLVRLEDTEKKRGVIEKRYRSLGKTVSFEPPPEEATAEMLTPFVAEIARAVRSTEPALAAKGRAALVGHIAEARIGARQQRAVARRLAQLARYVANLPDDPEGTLMLFGAVFGPRTAADQAASADAGPSDARSPRR